MTTTHEQDHSSSKRLGHALVVALALAVGLSTFGHVPASRASASTVSGHIEPTPTLSDIAEQIPTTFASGPDSPTLGELTADGHVSVDGSPSEISISTDPTEGATILDGSGLECEFSSADAGAGDAGQAGDHVMVYGGEGATLAGRATSEGGFEWIDVVAEGQHASVWTLDCSKGRLIELDGGGIAVVDYSATAPTAVADAAAQISTAEGVRLDATFEELYANYTDEQLTATTIQLADAGPLADDLAASSDPVNEPSDAEVTGPGGSMPPYLLDAAPTSEAEASVVALEAQVDRVLYTVEDLALIESTQGQRDDAARAMEHIDEAAPAAVNAAGITENNAMFTEELDLEDLGVLADEASAELDISDPAAEEERSAIALLYAQAEVGDAGKVLGVFDAPMSKTADTAIPVSTTVELLDAKTIAVRVPDVGEAVVVDPFFAPLAIFIGRVVLQEVAKAAVKAAAQWTARRLALKTAQQAAKRIAEAKAKEFLRQQAIKQAAAERLRQATLAQLRARAQAALKVLEKKATEKAAQLRAQQAKAKALMKKSAEKARGKAKETLDLGKQKAKDARHATTRAITGTAKRAVQVTRRQVSKTVKRVQTKAVQVKDGAKALQDIVRSTVVVAKTPAGREFAGEFLSQQAITAANATFKELVLELVFEQFENGDCLATGIYAVGIDFPPAPSTPGGVLASSIFTAADAYDCAKSMAGDASAEAAKSDGAGDASVDAYGAAQRSAESRRVAFGQAPAGTPPSVEIVAVLGPSPVKAPGTGAMLVQAINRGPAVSLAGAVVALSANSQYVKSGQVSNDPARLVLVDQNADGNWGYGESARAMAELEFPVLSSQSVRLPFQILSGGSPLPGGVGSLTLDVRGPNLPSSSTLTAASGKSGQVPLTWTAADADANAPVTGYEVERSGSAALKVVGTAHTFTGLTNGSTYKFRVRACSKIVGCGTWSPWVSATPYTVPGKVSTPSISSSNNALNIKYSAPSSGGSPVTKYNIGGGVTASTTSTTYTHKTGQSGSARNYRVQACNNAGCGPWGAYSNTLRPKVITMVKGMAAPKGRWYDTSVYGVAGQSVTLECHGPAAGAWWTQKVTLNSDGYYRDSTLCYTAYKGGHWVIGGTLKSNSVTW